MASSAHAASRFALIVALKAALIGALVFAAFAVVSRSDYYATALGMLTAAALVALSLVRTARAADRLYADFVTALTVSAFDRPATQARHFPTLADTLRRASDQLTQDRQSQARETQALEALLDTLSAALFALRENGELLLTNRAARNLAGEETKWLVDIVAIGPITGTRLMELAVGAREIVPLADGRRMLASVAMFRGAEGVPLRLISLQGLSSELSAVETRAWHDFVRVLSHEMMNSLTPVVSMSDSLQQLLATQNEPALQEARSAVDVIARRSAGLMSFVERYRCIAELPEPQLKLLSLSDLLDDLALVAVEYGKEHAIVYHSHVEPADLMVRADPDLLQQALINLVKNAAEAVSGVPEPQVEVTCRAAEHQILIEIRDNGAGPPESEPEQIFTPFFTTKAGGSGIGLALARQIAVAHGGELTVQCLSPGAVFRLGLPLNGSKGR